MKVTSFIIIYFFKADHEVQNLTHKYCYHVILILSKYIAA